MDPEISLYNALEDIYIDEPNYFFGEKIINYGITRPVLQTPSTSPTRDYDETGTGDQLCDDSVNLDEFFASVFNRDEEDNNGGAVLNGQNQGQGWSRVGSAVISNIKGQAEQKVDILRSGSSAKTSSVVCQNEIFQDQPACSLSFGEEIDEYIRVHLMPYCSQDHHPDPPAVQSYDLMSEILPRDEPRNEKISFPAQSFSEDCEEDSFKNATDEGKTAAEVKQEMQLKFMTPVVVLQRLQTINSPIPESIPLKPAAPIMSPFRSKSTIRTCVSTGGKVAKGRKRGRATAIIKQTLKMTSSSSMNSTPVTTMTGSRKRGRPSKVNSNMEATPGSFQDVITIDDEPEKKPAVIAAAITTTSSRPRRSSIGAVYYGDPDSDDTDEGPRSAKIKRPMSAPRNKQNKKADITDNT